MTSATTIPKLVSRKNQKISVIVTLGRIWAENILDTLKLFLIFMSGLSRISAGHFMARHEIPKPIFSNGDCMGLSGYALPIGCTLFCVACLGSISQILDENRLLDRFAHACACCANASVFCDSSQAVPEMVYGIIDRSNPYRFLFSVPRATCNATCAIHIWRCDYARCRARCGNLVYFACWRNNWFNNHRPKSVGWADAAAIKGVSD